MYIRIVGTLSKGGFETINGLPMTIGFRVQAGQVDQGIDESWVNRQGLLPLFDGLARLPKTPIDATAMIVQIRKFRMLFQCPHQNLQHCGEYLFVQATLRKFEKRGHKFRLTHDQLGQAIYRRIGYLVFELIDGNDLHLGIQTKMPGLMDRQG